MAIVYGISQSERSVIERTPESVKKLADVDKVHKKLISEFDSSKKKFFESLPEQIKKNEEKLAEIKMNKKIIHDSFDEKIKQLDAQKTKGPFQSVVSHVKIIAINHYSKPKEMRQIQRLEDNQNTTLHELQKNPEKIFNNFFKEERDEIQKFSSIKKTPEYKGAKGEVSVLERLSQLSNDFYVFCDVQIQLPKYVSYRGQKNLGSAQMDYVVVSTHGVVMIEVKNWSTSFYEQHKGLSPHEQTERAGLVLWIALKTWRRSPKITSILLAVQNNMRFDPKYKHAFVSNLSQINFDIEKRNDNLPEKEVERIVNLLKKFVPK